MTIEFNEYVILQESMNTDVGELKNDDMLTGFLAMGYPELKDAKAIHNSEMDKHGLRVLSFKNPQGVYELHIHNNYAFPGAKVETGHRAMMHTLKVMHGIAKQHLENGHKVQIQVGPSGDNYDKYHSLANKLVTGTNYKVTEVGDQPLSSIPGLKTKAFLIENVHIR